MASISIGLVLPSREAILFDDGEPGHLLQQAAEAEREGFDSLWVGDSLLARPRFEPIALLASVAAITQHITLGTAVLLPALRHPLLLAHSVATLDRLARGRLILGFGAGTSTSSARAEHEAAGIPFGQRFGRLQETANLFRSLWGRQTGDLTSKYWSLGEIDLLPKPMQTGGPALWLGGHGPVTLERAGAQFDGWFPLSPTPAAYERGLATVREAALRAGRDWKSFSKAVYLTVTVGDNRAAAIDEQRAFMEAYYDMSYDRLVSVQGCHAGTLASTVDWVRSYVEAGAQHVVLRLGCRDHSARVSSMRALLGSLRAA